MLAVSDGAGSTGSLLEAAVDGLMSCMGDGLGFIEASWIADAIPRVGLDIVATSEY